MLPHLGVSFAVSTCLATLSAALAAPAASGVSSLLCQSQSQPNPISKQYPNDTTGTINGTTAIVPIPLSVARSIIPAQYGIITKAYKEIFPDLPEGVYPAVLEALQDHDVGDGRTVKIPDFQRLALKFPFVDRLNDGYSCFKFTTAQIISPNLVAVLGSTFYGQTVPGTFDPPCDAYAGDGQGNTFLNAYAAPKSKALGSSPDIASTFARTGSVPYSMRAFRNVSNQPSFGANAPVCDNYITLFNSSVTQGQYAPVPVKGTIKIVPPYYATNATFTNVYGYRMDNAFIERNYVPCENLKGYHGTGPGDSG